MSLKERVKVIFPLLILAIIIFFFYFQYRYAPKTQEEKILLSFVKENLNDKYVPKTLNVVHRLTYNNKTDGLSNLYGSIWLVNGIKIYSGLHKNVNKTGISDLEIFIFTKEIPDIIDENKSSMLFAKYFKAKNPSKIVCASPTNGVSFCEKFWKEENGEKKGMVVVSALTNKFIAMCKYPLESEEYGFSSCIRFK